MREIKHKYTFDIEVAPDREVLMSNEDGYQVNILDPVTLEKMRVNDNTVVVNKDAKAFVYSVATFNRDFDPITEQDKGYEQWHSFKGFFDGMKAKDTDSKKSFHFLVHNLGYDGNFIIYWALSNELTQVPAKDTLENYQFSVLQKAGTIYLIRLIYKGTKFVFEDTYSKAPYKLQKLGEIVGYPFKHKGVDDSFDYLKPRNTYDLTKEEEEYIIDDVCALALVADKLYTGMYLTIGATAWNDFISNADFTKDAANSRLKKWRWSNRFPNVVSESIMGHQYIGGFCDLIDAEPDKVYEKQIHMYDINSMYPYVMIGDKGAMPSGNPFEEEYVEGKDYTKDPLYAYFFEIEFQIRYSYINYYIAKHPRTLYETHTDVIIPQLVSILKRCYDFRHFKITKVYRYRKAYGVYTEYVKRHYPEKAYASDEVTRTLAKLLLNNLYGKTAQKRLSKSTFYRINSEGVLTTTHHDEEINTNAYHPHALTITQRARVLLFMVIFILQDAGYKVYYVDTDSIKTDADPDTFQALIGRLDPIKLGYWKYEGVASKSVFLCAKKYLMIADNGKVIAKGMSGINKADANRKLPQTIVAEDLTIDNYRRGIAVTVNRRLNVVNGLLLVPRKYVIH